MTHGEYGLPPPSGGEPVLVIGGPGTGRADRDRSTGRVIWLDPSIARSQHLGGIRRRRTRSAAEVQGNDSNLPRANRLSPSAARATVMITTPARIAVTWSRPHPWTGGWPTLRGSLAPASIRLRAYAYARDRSVPGLVRDIVVRRLRSCPGLGPRWDGQAW